MVNIIDTTFVIGTIFLFYPFLIWFIRNVMRYGRGYVSPGFTFFWKVSFHTMITGLLIYVIGFLAILGVL